MGRIARFDPAHEGRWGSCWCPWFKEEQTKLSGEEEQPRRDKLDNIACDWSNAGPVAISSKF